MEIEMNTKTDNIRDAVEKVAELIGRLNAVTLDQIAKGADIEVSIKCKGL